MTWLWEHWKVSKRISYTFQLENSQLFPRSKLSVLHCPGITWLLEWTCHRMGTYPVLPRPPAGLSSPCRSLGGFISLSTYLSQDPSVSHFHNFILSANYVLDLISGYKCCTQNKQNVVFSVINRVYSPVWVRYVLNKRNVKNDDMQKCYEWIQHIRNLSTFPNHLWSSTCWSCHLMEMGLEFETQNLHLGSYDLWKTSRWEYGKAEQDGRHLSGPWILKNIKWRTLYGNGYRPTVLSVFFFHTSKCILQ